MTLMKSFEPSNVMVDNIFITELEQCVSSVNKWMGTIRLNINSNKADLIYFNSKEQLGKCS